MTLKRLIDFFLLLLGIHWSLIEKGTRLQRLIGAMPNESKNELQLLYCY